jgi:hypothetical protein
MLDKKWREFLVGGGLLLTDKVSRITAFRRARSGSIL